MREGGEREKERTGRKDCTYAGLNVVPKKNGAASSQASTHLDDFSQTRTADRPVRPFHTQCSLGVIKSIIQRALAPPDSLSRKRNYGAESGQRLPLFVPQQQYPLPHKCSCSSLLLNSSITDLNIPQTA